jgi:hypothetical protein
MIEQVLRLDAQVEANGVAAPKHARKPKAD